MKGVKRYEVSLEPHNDDWALEYELTKTEIARVLGQNVVEIYHVGSTAIKGIVAKPILDIAVSVKVFEDINIDGMKALGYDYCGESGVPGRCLFVLRRGDLSLHHIHCYPDKHENLIANIRFRDYLNQHPEYAKQYNDLKLRLYELYPTDRFKYTDGKEEFVKLIGILANEAYQ